MSTELTKLYPMVQFKKDTWEIDEFDCASIYLLIGTEKAMVIDCGMGIGDLLGAVRMITDLPLITVLSHAHPDHTGNARQFGDVWLHPADQGRPIPDSLQRRRFDTERIAARQKGSIGAPYNMFHLYPFDIDVDLREPTEPIPVIHDLSDGQQFDLGGGRVVTAYECPGHTYGEMVFLDESTRSLFAGDAVNFNLGLSVPVESCLPYYRRLLEMKGCYDGIYNGHHDFRALGMPLDDDCLPTIIKLMEEALSGHINSCEVPSFWGQSVPLTRSEARPDPSGAQEGKAAKKKRVFLREGRNFLAVNPDNIIAK